MPAEELALAASGDVGTGDTLRKQWLVTAKGRGAVRQRARSTEPSITNTVLRITRISAECAACMTDNSIDNSIGNSIHNINAMPLT